MEVCVRAVDLLIKGVEDPAPVYLLKGTDGYVRREVVRTLQETVPPEAREMCLEEYGDDDDIYTVVANLSTVSMFGGRKVVYLRRQKDLNDRDKKLLKVLSKPSPAKFPTACAMRSVQALNPMPSALPIARAIRARLKFLKPNAARSSVRSTVPK